MNSRTIIERIAAIKTLWAAVLPDVPSPPDATLVIWLNSYGSPEGDPILESALAHAPQRVARWKKKYGCIEPTHVYKFISTFLYQSKKAKKAARALDKTNVNRLLATLSKAVEGWEPSDRRSEHIAENLLAVVDEWIEHERTGRPVNAEAMRAAAVLAVDGIELDSGGCPSRESDCAVAKLVEAMNEPEEEQ
jgi:hypothetical protein